MKPKKRQKLCQNCEGEIDLDVIVCPFCAADLREEKPEQKPFSASHNSFYSSQQMSESLYPPPLGDQPSQEASFQESSNPEDSTTRTIGSIALLAIGIQLFLFSCFLLLFSHEGVLTLKWSSRFWFLYFFASLPFLLFGIRIFSRF